MEIMTTLAELPPHSLISEHKMAQLVGRHVSSVKRAVQWGELPPPVPWFGANIWTVAVILEHISMRLEAERQAAAQTASRVQHLRPGQGGRR
jgi:hypothetical protein